MSDPTRILPHHLSVWHVLVAVVGLVAAVVVLVVTSDVVWTIVALLVTVTVLRHLVRHDGANG